MRKDQVVINTLVFQSSLDKGVSQQEFIEGLSELGVRNIEIRREYIQNDDDLKHIASAARQYGMTVYYSVPDSLFNQGRLNRSPLQSYLEEARLLDAKGVKFTKGDFTEWDDQDVTAFLALTKGFKGLLTVENDQTQLNGKMEALQDFLELCEGKNLPIYATFDVGNSLWVGEKPSESISKIKRFIRFVHLKDVKVVDSAPEAALLGEGQVPWRSFIREFEPNMLNAIEYPCGETPFDVLRLELAKLEQAEEHVL